MGDVLPPWCYVSESDMVKYGAPHTLPYHFPNISMTLGIKKSCRGCGKDIISSIRFL